MLALAAVSVVLLAAVLAVGRVFYLKLDSRIRVLETPRFVYSTRYSPPLEDEPTSTGFPAGLDTVGEWAAECADMGVRVTDEEIALQRQMRREMGL